MPSFTITFSGLNAFVFNRPLKKGNTPDGATLVIPNLLKPRTLQEVNNGQPELLDPHLPLLLFDSDLRDAAASTTLPDAMLHQDPAPGLPKTGACLLFNVDLEILADGKPLAGPVSLTDDPPTGTAGTTLGWMATMDDAFPGKGSANPALLAAKLPLDLIVARLPLRGGTLITSRLTDFPCRFAFPGSPFFNQFMARELQFSVPFQNEIAITMTGTIQDSTPTRSQLVLRNGGGDVAVRIVNTEANDLLGLPLDYHANRPEADFEIFFDLIAAQTPGTKRTFPALQRPHGSESGGPHGVCPPAGMSM